MKIGDEVRFTPSGFGGESVKVHMDGGMKPPPVEVTGKIIAINHEYRHYTAEYEVFGNKLRESFKF